MTYNKHIFDLNDRKLIRDFESAYKNHDAVYPTQYDISTPKFRLVTDYLQVAGSGKTVLDIGAGYGVFVNYLQSLGIDVVGVEISPSAVAQGKEKFGSTLNLQTGDIIAGLDFPDNRFDCVICFGVITWLLDKADECLRELKRVLKPGGMVAISMGYKDTNQFFRDVISSNEDFVRLIGKHFVVQEFFIHYHELGVGTDRAQNFSIDTHTRDLIAFATKG